MTSQHPKPSRNPHQGRNRPSGTMPSNDILALLSGGPRVAKPFHNPVHDKPETAAGERRPPRRSPDDNPVPAATEQAAVEPPVDKGMPAIAEQPVVVEAPASPSEAVVSEAAASADDLSSAGPGRSDVVADIAPVIDRTAPWRESLRTVAKEMTRAANFATSALQQNRTPVEIRNNAAKLNERARSFLGDLPDDINAETLAAQRVTPLQKAAGALMRFADKAASPADALEQALERGAMANNAFLMNALQTVAAEPSVALREQEVLTPLHGEEPPSAVVELTRAPILEDAERPAADAVEPAASAQVSQPLEAVAPSVAATTPVIEPETEPEPLGVAPTHPAPPAAAAEDFLLIPPQVSAREPAVVPPSVERTATRVEDDLESLLVAPTRTAPRQDSVARAPAPAAPAPATSVGRSPMDAVLRPSKGLQRRKTDSTQQIEEARVQSPEPLREEPRALQEKRATPAAPSLEDALLPPRRVTPAREIEVAPPAPEPVIPAVEQAHVPDIRTPLEELLNAHLRSQNFDDAILGLVVTVVDAIKDNARFRPAEQSLVVLHKTGDSVATATTKRSLPIVAASGDTVLDVNVAEYLARLGLNTEAMSLLRGVLPAVTARSTDLEVASRLGAGFLRRSDAEGVPVALLRELQDISVEAQRQMTEQTDKAEAQNFSLDLAIRYWGVAGSSPADVVRAAPAEAARIQEERAGRAPVSRMVAEEKPLTGLLRKRKTA